MGRWAGPSGRAGEGGGAQGPRADAGEGDGVAEGEEEQPDAWTFIHYVSHAYAVHLQEWMKVQLEKVGHGAGGRRRGAAGAGPMADLGHPEWHSGGAWSRNIP